MLVHSFLVCYCLQVKKKLKFYLAKKHGFHFVEVAVMLLVEVDNERGLFKEKTGAWLAFYFQVFVD